MARKKTDEAKTILVIEDNLKHSSFLKDVLEEDGFFVRIASKGKQVPKKTEELKKYGLIILDIAVPKFDAIDFLTEYYSLPILVLSAYANEPNIKQICERYRIPKIKKPFDYKALLKEIHKIIK